MRQQRFGKFDYRQKDELSGGPEQYSNGYSSSDRGNTSQQKVVAGLTPEKVSSHQSSETKKQVDWSIDEEDRQK